MSESPFPFLDRFVAFIVARENVRRAKALGYSKGGQGPVDPIIAEWRFCNVNREDDTVTKWIAKNLRTETDPRALVMKLAVGRFINWPNTISVFLENREVFKNGWDGFAFVRQMARLQELGEKVYTGAYMIRAGTGADAKMPKHEYLVKRVFDPLWKKLQAGYPGPISCGFWDEYLGTIFGMGDFMRNQIITDMKYTKLLPKNKTVDWTTFCLAGPGTNRGLSRVLGAKLVTSRPPGVANERLQRLRDATVRQIAKHSRSSLAPLDWYASTFDDLNNLSNCLCEFDKYERVRLGEGQPRSRYRPA